MAELSHSRLPTFVKKCSDSSSKSSILAITCSLYTYMYFLMLTTMKNINLGATQTCSYANFGEINNTEYPQHYL